MSILERYHKVFEEKDGKWHLEAEEARIQRRRCPEIWLEEEECANVTV